MEKLLDLPEEIYQGFTIDQFAIISSIMEEVTFPQNHVVFRQGTSARFIYIVAYGCVDIQHKPYDGPPIFVARIIKGDFFGWSALLQREVYTSSAICQEASKLYRISLKNLLWLCENNRETGIILLQQITNIFLKRMRTKRSDIFQIIKNSIIPD